VKIRWGWKVDGGGSMSDEGVHIQFPVKTAMNHRNVIHKWNSLRGGSVTIPSMSLPSVQQVNITSAKQQEKIQKILFIEPPPIPQSI
jgi:hypothetical protein